MAKAEPGQVLTTADVLERCRSIFESTELEPFRLKGIDEPVTAFDLTPSRQPPPPGPSSACPSSAASAS